MTDRIEGTLLDVLVYESGKGERVTEKRGFSALSFRVEASGCFWQQGRKIPAMSGDICFVPENVGYRNVTDGEKIIVIHFNMISASDGLIRVFTPQQPEKYHALFGEILSLWQQKKTGYRYAATAVFYTILCEMAVEFPDAADSKKRYIFAAQEYIRDNFGDSSLCVSQIARYAGVSDSLLRREFRKMLGASTQGYLEATRMQYAKSLLEYGYFSQKEIAARCGFSDVKYFRAAFKRYTGMCVSAYKYSY